MIIFAFMIRIQHSVPVIRAFKKSTTTACVLWTAQLIKLVVMESTGTIMGHASANKVDWHSLEGDNDDDDGDDGRSVRCQLDQALIQYYGYVLLGD